MDVRTNVFCASGMHLPNGSFATFGGNGAVGVGGGVGSQMDPAGGAAYFDDTYQNYDGRKAIRVINPCKSSDNFDDVSCQWFDNPEVLSMQKNRWYSAAEPLGDGTVVLIGGFVNGGYVNRNWPNVDPEFEGGAADCTYEYYPANGREAQTMQFMIKTSGLNSYAHTYLMKSGKMLIQANYSTSKSLRLFPASQLLTFQKFFGITRITLRKSFLTFLATSSVSTQLPALSLCFP